MLAYLHIERTGRNVRLVAKPMELHVVHTAHDHVGCSDKGMEGRDYEQQYNDNGTKIENCCGYARGIRNVKGWLVDVHETFFQQVQMAVVRAHSLSTYRT